MSPHGANPPHPLRQKKSPPLGLLRPSAPPPAPLQHRRSAGQTRCSSSAEVRRICGLLNLEPTSSSSVKYQTASRGQQVLSPRWEASGVMVIAGYLFFQEVITIPRPQPRPALRWPRGSSNTRRRTVALLPNNDICDSYCLCLQNVVINKSTDSSLSSHIITPVAKGNSS